MKIFANAIVNNEENFIWFALMSVIDYVDKILVWDSGSTDKTVEIIKEVAKIKNDKIDFKQVGSVDKNEFTIMRQKMLDESPCDWILLLDGDEIWWDDSIKKLKNFIIKNEDKIDAVVTPFYNAVGDLYHFQPEKVGAYELIGRKGHLTIRAIRRNIPGLHVGGAYGSEGYLDEDNLPIQKRSRKRIIYLDAPFLHLTHLKRSSQDHHGKFKYEFGLNPPKDFNLPEIFYSTKIPKIVPSLYKRNTLFKVLSLLKIPYLKFRRKM